MKILIAYDGSDYANAAIEDLTRAGLPEDTRSNSYYRNGNVAAVSAKDTLLYPGRDPDEPDWIWRNKPLKKK
jgi:hypothetical protein